MGVDISAGKWGLGPGNVLATPRDLVRAVRALVRTGKIQANPVLVREVRDLGRTGRGQDQGGMVKVVMVKVLVTKVRVSTATKWDTRQQSA